MPSSREYEPMQDNTTIETQGNTEHQVAQHHHRRWIMVLQTMTLVTVLLLSVYNHALLGASHDSSTASQWLVESEPFEGLAPCNEGGVRLHTGFDTDQNGILEADERQDSAVLCHGLRGLSGPQGQAGFSGDSPVPQRLSTDLLPPGDEHCPQGGVAMNTGLDLNTNDVLEPEEVSSQTMVWKRQFIGSSELWTHGDVVNSSVVHRP